MTYPDGYNPPRFMYSKSRRPNSNPNSSRPGPSNRYDRPDRHSQARAAEREESCSSDDDDEAVANQTSKQVKFSRNSRFSKSRRPHGKPRRVRQTNEVNETNGTNDRSPTEILQNSDRDANETDASDDEHHSRLAVAFDKMEFP